MQGSSDILSVVLEFVEGFGQVMIDGLDVAGLSIALSLKDDDTSEYSSQLTTKELLVGLETPHLACVFGLVHRLSWVEVDIGLGIDITCLSVGVGDGALALAAAFARHVDEFACRKELTQK